MFRTLFFARASLSRPLSGASFAGVLLILVAGISARKLLTFLDPWADPS